MAEKNNPEVKPEVKSEPNSIENWLDNEDKATDAIIAGLDHPATEEVKETVETPEEKPEEPPSEPTPGETPKPAVEEPEKPQPVEAKPAVVEPEKAKRWAELRTAQREKKQLEEKLKAQEAELARLREKPAEEQVEEYEPPATKSEVDELKAKTADYDNQLAELRRAEQTRIMVDAIQREEAAFEKEHPDYREAVDYITQVQRREFELGGQLDAVASELIQTRPEDIANIASKYNVAPEQCARDLAFHILFETRKKDFATRNVGKVAKNAYDLAQAYGYKPKGKEPVKEEPKAATPQDRVLRAVKNQAVTQSLSAMTPAGGARGREITTRAELMALDPTERDSYIDEADRKNPKWLEELE